MSDKNDETSQIETASSQNPAKLKRKALQALLPEVFSEGSLDVAALKRALGEDLVVEAGERYRLDWVGKTEAYRTLQATTTSTLRPMREQSVNFDTANHVFIEGENLETLKVIQKAYFGQVKLIYIDPPYNTGSDNFVYPDRFGESKEDYLRRINELDEQGALLREGQFRKNSRESGHYHSNWLSMMLPRLYIARNLLRDDGVIFVSCDDNEVFNLRCLMNEIFGEENFLAALIIQSNKRGQTYKDISKTHEYLLVFGRSGGAGLGELEKSINENAPQDSEGPFELWELRNRNPRFGKHNRPNLYFPVFVNPQSVSDEGFAKLSLKKDSDFNVDVLPLNSNSEESCWRWSKKKIQMELDEFGGLALVAKQKRDGEWGIYQKARKSTKKAKSIWSDTAVINEQGTKELGRYGLGGIFDHPKPVGLLRRIIQLSTEPNDLVLDFFAGSGTTLDAVLQQNAEDGGNRRCILVQMAEPLDADNAEFSDIAQVARTRVRRALEKLRESDDLLNKVPEGEGFRAFKLAPSCFPQWRPRTFESGEELEQQIKLFMDTEPGEHDPQAIAQELLLKYGYPLTTRVGTLDIGGAPVQSVDDGKLLLVLETFTAEMIGPLVELKPERIIALDTVFRDSDELKTNLALQCRDAGIRIDFM